jgi:predicted nucleic acid-binding Zn ribbon protein
VPDERPPPEQPTTSRAPDDDTTDHDTTGLELAKAIAASMRAKVGPGRTRGAKAARTRRRFPTETSLSGAHPDERDPASIAAALDRLVADSGWGTDIAVHGVFGRWAAIVGADVAAHCTPEAFADGHLVVRADSTAWATQVRYLAPTLVRRLNEELGHGTVLVIDVQGPTGPTWRKGLRSVRDGRGPRDTYG